MLLGDADVVLASLFKPAMIVAAEQTGEVLDDGWTGQAAVRGVLRFTSV